ncbi:hypothetical protein BXO88_12155 [Oribacterium sp. C9]|uniref:hypothetical protein n=1 Tax=Oribacterium sp. C9 TaxID=1943579 RepID=UPI00098F137D|nr:hypothetical protein [Oribacterium sp. C9]OON85534.1 hypothetical protein BXO88_12155 [Oribacterium sp. C9]
MKMTKISIDINAHISNLTYEVKIENQKPVAIIGFNNLGEGVIKAIKFNAKGYNSFGDNIEINGEEQFDLVIQDLSIEKNTSINNIKVDLPSIDIRKLVLSEKQICFSDERVISYEGEDTQEYEIEMYDIYGEDQEASNALKNKFGMHFKYKPTQFNKGWICGCGRYNNNQYESCSKCNTSKADAFKYTSEPEISNLILLYKKAKETKEEMHRQAAKQAEKQASKSNIIKILVGCIAIMLVVALSVYKTYSDRKSFSDEYAMKMFALGNYTYYEGKKPISEINISDGILNYKNLETKDERNYELKKWNPEGGTFYADTIECIVHKDGEITFQGNRYDVGKAQTTVSIPSPKETVRYIVPDSDEKILDYINKITKGFVCEKDDFKETSFIYHIQANKSKDPLYMYIGIKGTTHLSLHIVCRHNGASWIFFNKAQLKADNGVFTIFDNIASYDKYEDVTYNGKVIEKYDLHPVNDNLIDSFNKLSSNKSYTLRLSGKDHYREYEIEPNQIQAIQETIDCYKKIKDVLETRIVPKDNTNVNTNTKESELSKQEIPSKRESQSSDGEFYIDVQSIGGQFAPAKYINIDDDSLAFVISQTWDDHMLYKYSEIGTGDTSSRKLTAKFENDKLILTSNDGYDVTITCDSKGNAICKKNGVEQSNVNERKLDSMDKKQPLSKNNAQEDITSESDSKDGIEVVSTHVGQSTASSDKKVTIKVINHTDKTIKSIKYILRGERNSYSESGTYEFTTPLEIEKKSQINIDVVSDDVRQGNRVEFEIIDYTYTD